MSKKTEKLAYKVLSKYIRKMAGPLSNPDHLSYQAIFLMGTSGSGKTFLTENKYLKYMPGGGASGVTERKRLEKMLERNLPLAERSLSNISFEKSVETLRRNGIEIELLDKTRARIPFRLYSQKDQEEIPPEDWATQLPRNIYQEVKGITEVIFSAPIKELPSYWRQVNRSFLNQQISFDILR